MKLRLLLPGAFVALLAAAGFASASDLPKLDIEKYTLSNGLEVILHQDRSTPIATVNIWYHVGSKNERPGRTGFAHLFEHMMFQGSEHQDAEYFGPLQSIGATMNGSTSEDRTNYWEVIPSQHLERALLMEADRMGWLLPAMTEEKFKNQQDVVRNERRQSEGQPYAVVWLQANEILYPKGHPYDHSVIGSHEDLAAATLEDVKDFFRTYYTPNNATLCVAGDFDRDQVKRWIEQYFGEIPPGPPVTEFDVWVPELAVERRVRMEDRVQLPRVVMFWHTVQAFGPGDAELDLAARILGQGTTSRLYRRLVHESRKAQDVMASQDNSQISSTFMIQATLKPGVTVAEVEAIIAEELAKFRTSGPTADELQRAKNEYEAGFIKGIQRVGGFGSKSDLLNRYNHYVGSPDFLEQDLARYTGATATGVRDAFARWIHDGRYVFEVHPAGHAKAGPAASVDRAKLPEGGPAPGLDVPSIAKAMLPNGLEIRVMEQRELPLVQVQIVFRSGASSDPADRSGLADMAGAMLQEGTKTRDKFVFADALARLGTDMNVRVDYDQTVVGITTLRKHLDASVELVADALRNAAFPAAEFDLAKDRRLVNIGREKENAMITAGKVGRRLAFGDAHPYSRRSTGTAASIGAITVADAQAFAKAHFTPGNAVLVAVGDVTAAEIEAAATKHLGTWTGAAPVRPAFPEPAAIAGRTIYLVDKPGDTQSTISIVHAGVPRNHPDWEKLYVANRVLGGYFTSRLNLNIREDKGYSYGVRSQFSENVKAGLFSAGGRVQTEVTAPALVEFIRELEGIHGDRPVTEKELTAARNSVVLAYPGEFETNGEIAGSLVEQVVFGLAEDHLETYPKKIAAVTVDDVNAAGRTYVRADDLAIVVVGDVAKIEDSVRKLNLGKVVLLDADGNPVEKADNALTPAGAR